MSSNVETTCLVLGGRGFVGSAVTAEAQRRGYRVHAVTRDNYEAFKGATCDLLINANGNSKKYLAAQDPALDFDLSVRSVIATFRDFRARRYVHISSVDVYADVGDPRRTSEATPLELRRLSPYGFHKALSEEIVRYYAERWLILRAGGFVGPGLKKNSVYDMLRGLPLRVHLDSEYQYLDTRDFARILFDLVEKGVEQEIFNVAGDGAVSLRTVASWIPHFDPTRCAQELPRERYEVALDRIKQFVVVPKTAETVRRFVQDVLEGRENIA